MTEYDDKEHIKDELPPADVETRPDQALLELARERRLMSQVKVSHVTPAKSGAQVSLHTDGDLPAMSLSMGRSWEFHISSGTGEISMSNGRSKSLILRRESSSDSAFEKYAWVPPGLTPAQVHQYFRCLPEDKVPYVQSMGERYRLRQLLRQLPPHDCEGSSTSVYFAPFFSAFCVTPCVVLWQIQCCCLFCARPSTAVSCKPDLSQARERKEEDLLILFGQKRKLENLGRGSVRPVSRTMSGTVCQKCGHQIGGGDVAVFASRAGLGSCWHPQCFSPVRSARSYFVTSSTSTMEDKCTVAGTMLNFSDHDAWHIIFSVECTQAEGFHWHTRHFCCFECECSVVGHRHVMKDKRPYCSACYEKLYTQYCDSCGEIIGVDEGQLSHGGQHWHASERCFCCDRCGSSLLGRPFLPRHGQIYCSRACSLPRTNSERSISPAQSDVSTRKETRDIGTSTNIEPEGENFEERRMGGGRRAMSMIDQTRTPQHCNSYITPPRSIHSSLRGAPREFFSRECSQRRSLPDLRSQNRTGPRVTFKIPLSTELKEPIHFTCPSFSSTSSSSSDEEEDGYFLGEPIPLPAFMRPPGHPTPPKPPPTPKKKDKNCNLS
ncbi:unnamed protein product [Ranitomeya imitator]|uniref:Uncharacterized protein n=1 Tax=Ranitomeya imitator TaxID=111125 RepID=A0ABN9LMF0_9NEOB|nr:unnamed protein product [Ranitomeya imitator]